MIGMGLVFSMSEYTIGMTAKDFRQLKRLSDIRARQHTTEHTLAVKPAITSFLEQLELGLTGMPESVETDEQEVSLTFEDDELAIADRVELTALEYGVSPEHLVYSAIIHAIDENHRTLRAETQHEVDALEAREAELDRQLGEIERGNWPDTT